MTYLLACAGAYLAALFTVWMSVRLTGRPHLGLALGMFAISLAAITAAALAIAGMPSYLAESGASLARATDLARTYANGVVVFFLPLIAQAVLSLPFILIMRESGWADDETEMRGDSHPDEAVMTGHSMGGPSVGGPPVESGAAGARGPAPGQRVEPTVY